MLVLCVKLGSEAFFVRQEVLSGYQDEEVGLLQFFVYVIAGPPMDVVGDDAVLDICTEGPVQDPWAMEDDVPALQFFEDVLLDDVEVVNDVVPHVHELLFWAEHEGGHCIPH